MFEKDHITAPGLEHKRLLESLGKKMSKDALLYSPSFMTRALVGFASVIIYTRIFSPFDYGHYVIAISTIGMISLLISNWIQQSTLRYRAGFIEEGKRADFNLNIIELLFLISFSFILIGLATFPLFKSLLPDYTRYYWVSLAYLCVDLWFINLCYVLMADLHSLRYSLFLSIGSLLAFGIALIWIFFIRRDPLWIIWGLLLSDVILIFPLLIASSLLKGTRDIWGKEREEKVFRFLKRYAVYGFPLIGWFLGIFLLNLSDRYFIQAYQGSAQVGIYSSNYNLVLGIFNLIAAPIISAAHPIIMKTASSDNVDKGQLPDIIKSFSRYYLFVSIPIFIFMSILAKNIVTVFLGVEYREGYVIIPIILFGYFAWNFAMYGHKGLELEEKTKIMLFFVFICALCNVALNFLFVPLFGYVGAAVTSLIGLTLYPVLVYFGSRKTMPWRVPWAYIAKALAASSVMAGILLVFDRFLRPDSTLITLIIEGTLAAIIYLAGMAILGEVKVGRLAELRYLAARRSN